MTKKFTRPNLPYEAEKMANYDRYSSLGEYPPTAEMFDADMNQAYDAINEAFVDIENSMAKGLIDADKIENKDKLITTDGKGHPNWIFANSNNIEPNAIRDIHIRKGSVTKDKIQPQNITHEEMADNAAITRVIANASITTPKLAPGHVTQACMANNSVGTAQVINANITEPKLANLAVTTPKVADNAITMQKLAADVTLEIMKVIFPIGSVYICFANQNPPFHGAGITWTLLDEGRAVMTGNAGNTGTTAGANRLDNGNTNGHALTVQQMPAHSHNIAGSTFSHASGATCMVGGMTQQKNTNTNAIGEGQAHSHTLGVLNYKLLFYRRTA